MVAVGIVAVAGYTFDECLCCALKKKEEIVKTLMIWDVENKRILLWDQPSEIPYSTFEKLFCFVSALF
jgi:hypothetical protein